MTDQSNKPKHVSTGPVLSAFTYEKLKWFSLIFLPALAVLYVGLSAFWPLPAPTAVAGSIALLNVFMGTILGISSNNFQKQGADGSINAVIEGDEVILSRLALPTISADELAAKKSITIQVNPQN